MSYIDHNPRVAWAMAFESGIRTQAAADLDEAGAKVQTSSPVSGGSYNDHYVPVYAAVRRLEREQPVIAAVGHWLCLADTGEANQYLDDVADTVLTRYIAHTPAWADYRKAKKARVEALVAARMMMERNNMDGTRATWGPATICTWAHEWTGVRIIADNWQRDGWDAVWQRLGDVMARLESEAMEPIAEVSRAANRATRDELRAA